MVRSQGVRSGGPGGRSLLGWAGRPVGRRGLRGGCSFVELIVGTLVVLGLLAISIRFAPRTPSGEIVLPRVIDNSIGMWTLRRVTGLRLWERPPEVEASGRDADADVDDVDRRLAGRGAESSLAARPAPITPVRRVVSGGRPDTRGLDAATARRVALLTVTGQRERAERLIRIAAARPAAAAGASQPRWASLGATAALLLAALLLLGVALQPSSSPRGQVLSATGLPGHTPPGPVGSPAAAAGGPTSSAKAGGTATTAPHPTPLATANPARTPRPGATPTRTPVPTPTPAPTPRPTPPKPTPSPTPPPVPTPTPTPAPPFAALHCSVPIAATTTCDGLESQRAVTYTFDFGDGSEPITGPVAIVPHTYSAPGDYLVRLTVHDADGNSDVDIKIVSVP